MIQSDFYRRDSAKVARDLLGMKLVKNGMSGRIVETEAYYGEDDPASHAFNGRTERNELMFGEPGRIYVYLCYGMYYLLNVTTHESGEPGAVLIRSLEPLKGIDCMKENRNVAEERNLTTGPGKLCEALGITKEYNGQYVTEKDSEIGIKKGERCDCVGRSKRVGVSENHHRDLRFFCKDSDFLSG